MKKIRIFYGLFMAVMSLQMHAQQNVSISDVNGATPDASSVLDVSSTTKGLLVPRVALTSTTNQSPIPNGITVATALLVYNTATSGDVTPGFYHWANNKWNRFDTGNNIGDWKLLGNSGTNASSNFLGTTDNVDLVFRTNNTEKVRVLSGGNVGIGEINPQRILHLKGTASNVALRLENSTVGARTFDIQSTNGGNLHIINQSSSPPYVAMQVNGTTNNIGFFNGTPDVSASLDITSLDPISSLNNRGILIPRLSLTATNAASPITSPATSLLVYNTATAGTTPNNVLPGYYYNSNTPAAPIWKRFATGNGDAWIVGGNNFGTVGQSYRFGTNSNDNIEFLSNNIARGRILNSGEFIWGGTTLLGPSLAGDVFTVYKSSGGTSNNWANNGINTTEGGGSGYFENTSTTTFYNAIEGGINYNTTGNTPSGIYGLSAAATGWGIGVSAISNSNVGNGLYAQIPSPNANGLYAIYSYGRGYSTGGWFSPSDANLKTNIVPIENAIMLISKINPVYFDFKDEYSMFVEGKNQIGFLAQNLEKVIPMAVSDVRLVSRKEVGMKNDNKVQSLQSKAVNYDSLIPLLTKAIQEQQAIIEELQKRIEILEKK